MKKSDSLLKFTAQTAAAALLLLLAAGCTSFDYVGRSFAPLPEDAPVSIFREADALPEGKYAIMGRGVLTAPKKYDRYDIDEKLGELAREYGADAVLIVNTRSILKTFNVPEGNSPFAGPSSPSTNPTNAAPDGQPLAESSFGTEVQDGVFSDAATLRQRQQHYGRTVVEVMPSFAVFSR